MTRTPLRRRLAALLLAAPLTLLAGCPADPDSATAAPGSASSQATAPPIGRPGAQQKNGNITPVQQPATSLQQPADAQQNAKIQQLIRQAENSYRSGVNNYNNTHLDAARLDFDSAVDAMLSSGYPLTGDTPLADEFERLVNAINSLEMAALKQGNGFSPKVEAAPLDLANIGNDITFPANPELVARLKSELNIASDLPLVINDQVAGYIGVFSNSSSFRAHMASSLRRAGRYRAMMQKILAEQGVPQDLIYLSVAESGFQPQALNTRSGAGGMWQFMPANDYLKRNGYYDERFDPEKSTRAYARYIKALYNEFGDWYLAMAAYDWGPGKIQHAVQRTGYADFWELYRHNAMPAETRAYVPQILAAVIMAKNPERYGLDKLTLDPPILYDTVTTNSSISLQLVADVTNASIPELVALNPSLLRLATPPDAPFDLHIPAGAKELYADRLKDIPVDRRTSWRFHVVKPGETLEAIATALHARPADIAETNGITTADPMGAGDELVVPVDLISEGHQQRYTIRHGDTLVSIADRFNISVEDLRRWNSLSTANFRTGHSLYVAEPVRLAPSFRAHGRSARSSRARRGASSTRGSRARGRKGASSARTAHGSTRGSSHPASRSTHAASSSAKRRRSR